MLAFVARLLQVQAVDASAYAAKAEKNRYLEYTVAAERGEITDRKGVALATSVDAHNITADPKMFTPEDSKAPDAPQQAAALLAPILGKDVDEPRREALGAQVPLHRPRLPTDPPGLEADQGPQVRLRREGVRGQAEGRSRGQRPGRCPPGADHQAGLPQRGSRRRDTGIRQRRRQGRRRPRIAAEQGTRGRGRQDPLRPGRMADGSPPRAAARSRPCPAPTSS